MASYPDNVDYQVLPHPKAPQLQTHSEFLPISPLKCHTSIHIYCSAMWPNDVVSWYLEFEMSLVRLHSCPKIRVFMSFTFGVSWPNTTSPIWNPSSNNVVIHLMNTFCVLVLCASNSLWSWFAACLLKGTSATHVHRILSGLPSLSDSSSSTKFPDSRRQMYIPNHNVWGLTYRWCDRSLGGYAQSSWQLRVWYNTLSHLN